MVVLVIVGCPVQQQKTGLVRMMKLEKWEIPRRSFPLI